MKLPHDVEAALRSFVEETRRRYGDRVREIRLFGSWARGTGRPRSDVDVFVVLEGATGAERLDLIDLGARLYASTGVDLAPLVWPPERYAQWLAHERRLALDIQREGVPV